MPCPHYRIKISTRSKSPPTTAQAAYQSGERLYDERTHRTKSYTEKRGIIYTEIMLPENALKEYADRNTLWNAVEKAETNWNAQTARRIEIALPKELPLETGLEMIRQHCREQFVSKGMIADKTKQSILITALAAIGPLSTPEIRRMMLADHVNISDIGKEKTALFVVVSDTDRSLDRLVNIFFTQAMNELCRVADNMSDSCFPVPVRFILDDFATNCSIEGFPRMISSIRSRGISTMLMIQAESQLSAVYGEDRKTIIGNCDTYLYPGGNDVETAENVALRCDMPLKKVLAMPVGTAWVFRRGSSPLFTRAFDSLDKFREMKEAEAEEELTEKSGCFESLMAS